MSAERCPVCQARFRGARICSRCGADLGCPMRLAAKAWRLREEARIAFAKGDFAASVEAAARAQEIQRTPSGEVLVRLATWLNVPA